MSKKEKYYLDLEGRVYFNNTKDFQEAIKMLAGQNSGGIKNGGKEVEPEDNDIIEFGSGW